MKTASAKAKARKTRAQALYPHLKITLATSDALGILTWGMVQKVV